MEIARKKPVDKITVKDLVEDCNISRQTFYYHFQDLLGVVEWLGHQALDQALEASLDAETPEGTVRAFLSVFLTEYEFIPKLLHSQKREYVEQLMVDCVRDYLRQMAKHQGRELNEEDWQTALDFYAYGISGLIICHCENKDTDTEKLSRQICWLIRNPPQLTRDPQD
jgi:AcrR family transcriptional regulator